MSFPARDNPNSETLTKRMVDLAVSKIVLVLPILIPSGHHAPQGGSLLDCRRQLEGRPRWHVEVC